MDFLEFLKSSCRDSYVRFEIQNNKIYKWQTTVYTGFSLYELSAYEFRVDYFGSATGYILQHYSLDYHIYKGGLYTSYDLHINMYGDLQLYYCGSPYSQSDYMKEKETIEEEILSHSSLTSSSEGDDDFSGGFWSWKTWGIVLVHVLLLTIGIAGILASMISPYFLIPAPAFMALWAVLLIIHNIRKK